MPLIKSASRKAVGTNIREMIAAGHPRNQAIAASLDTARRAGAHFARGGYANPYFADGGAPDDPIPPRWALPGQKNTAPATLQTPGDWAAMGASAADPFGLPSTILKNALPTPERGLSSLVTGQQPKNLGERWQDLEEAHPAASFAGSMLTPNALTSLPAKGLSVMGRLARSYPRAAALMGGLGMAGTAAEAGPPGGDESGQQTIPSLGPRPTHTPEESRQAADLQAQIEKINGDKQAAIDKINADLDKQLNPVDAKGRPDLGNKPGPNKTKALQAGAGAQIDKATADAAERSKIPQQRIDDLTGGVNKRIDAWEESKKKFDKDYAPIESKYPGEIGIAKTIALPAVTGALQYGGGKVAAKLAPFLSTPATSTLGRLGKFAGRLPVYAAGAGAGALEAEMIGALPQVYNQAQPEGSPAKLEADRASADKMKFATQDLGLEGMLGAAAGYTGTRYGLMHGVAGMLPKAAQAIQATQKAASAAPPARGKPWPVDADGKRVWPARSQDIEGLKHSGGQWRDRFGHVVPQNLRPPAPPPTGINAPAINSIPAEARGGSISNPYASGGVTPPFEERMAARGLVHEGQINSVVPGRTDQLPITVGGGSYIVPADHISALGQNNTAAGVNVMNRMLKMGPYGSSPAKVPSIRANIPRISMNMRAPKAGGGGAGVDIIAAGGEFAIPPHKVREIGGGDIDRGHKILDHWVMSTRKKHIKTLRGLKPPKKD